MKKHFITTALLILACGTVKPVLASPSVSPLQARPGDTFQLIATVDCPDGKTDHPLDKDSVKISGSDVTLTYVSSNDCSATYTAVVATKPINRELVVTLSSKGTPLGTFAFHIVDIPPGPIPPGLDPQVDAMYTILSERMCADQFGVRVARHYFCLNVSIGNNSGYPLILASIGFLRRDGRTEYRDTNASYLTVRSTTQQEHVFSARNLTLRSLEAAGVMIASFTPFSGNAGRRGRIGLWSALASTAASAWDSLIPDRTITTAANLDDAALRDGRLIPNNSPVRFAVFVDRDTVRPMLLQNAGQLEVSAQAADQMSAELRSRAAGAHNTAQQSNLTREADKLQQQASGLREEAKKRNENTTRQTRAKLDPLARSKAPLEDDLLSVRRALGSLIIVGDQIQYLQRVQVDASAVVPEIMPPPQIDSASEPATPGGSVDIVLLGKWLARATVTATKCDPKFTAVPAASGNSLTLKGFTLADCSETSIPLTIDNGGGTIVYNLAVKQKPSLDDPGAKNVVTIDQGKATLALTGKFLTEAKAAVTLGNGSNPSTLQSSDLTITDRSDTGLKVSFAVPKDYNKAGTTAKVSVTTASGKSNEISYTLALKPVLDTPKNAKVAIAGGKAVLALTGTSLDGAQPTVTLTKGSSSVVLKDSDRPIENASGTGLTVNATLPSDYAAAGTTVKIKVSTDAGVSNEVQFTLTAPAKKAAPKK